MADPCLANTNTAHPSIDGSGNLIVDVQLEPLNEGSLESDANGIGVTLSTTGGLTHSSGGMGLKTVGNNYAQSTDGIRFTNGQAQVGRIIGDDTTDTLSISILRGVTAVGSGPLTGSMQNSGPGLQYYQVTSNWEGFYSTTFVEFDGASSALDGVAVYLQRSFDGGGWVNLDWSSLGAQRQAHTFHLNYTEHVAIADTAAHTYQTRLVYSGSTVSGTAKQGTLANQYKYYIQMFW